MSSFLIPQAAGPTGLSSILQGNDERVNPENFQWFMPRRPAVPWNDGLLWPNSRRMGGDPTVPLVPVGDDANNTGRWGWIPEEGGTQTMQKIIGTTKDAGGNVLASCTVYGYLTSGSLFLRSVVSDAAGYFEFCSEYSGSQHYLVAYKTGPPDVTGATVNTLVPV